MSKDLSKKQKIIAATITSIGTVTIYSSGVNLAKNNPEYHNPIFISTIIFSFISPYLLDGLTIYAFKKFNIRQNKKIKKKTQE